MPGDNPTLAEKSAQHYVFLGGRNDADPIYPAHTPLTSAYDVQRKTWERGLEIGATAE